MKYLRKRKVHEMAIKVIGIDNVPKCEECHYKAYGGFEWLNFYNKTGTHISFTVRNCGTWARIVITDEYGKIQHDEVRTGLTALVDA